MATINSNGKKEKTIKEEFSTFERLPDLEPYFAAIKDSQILEITEESTNKQGSKIYTYNPFWYHASSISYFSERGFYPYCYDALHNKLLVAVNKEFKFMECLFVSTNDEDSTKILNEEKIELYFNTNFQSYEPQFFDFIPQNLTGKIKSVENLEFKFFSKQMFNDLLRYVINPTLIKEYEHQKKLVDSKDHGLITEDNDSFASEILDAILTWAVIHRGTDVHIEYTGEQYRARVRIDGDLVEYPKLINPAYYSALINVIRTRCEIDVAEQFKPQDGQMQFNCHFVEKGKVSSYYDIRVSIIPEIEGRKNAVLRIQQKGEFKKLDELGFSKGVYKEIQLLCQEPHGLILVTGPTGCGKTTTLYSMLNELNKMDVKILTAEDPVEIKMSGITQVSINEKQGRTFPNMLKFFLRHDPDIILVGEIRDPETTRIAISAANTGHLVLTTLHTNDSVSSIKRLTSMEGVDTADFAFALKGIMAQRLIKTFNKKIRNALLNISELPEDIEKLFNKGLLTQMDLGIALNTEIGENFFPADKIYSYDGDASTYEGRTAITEFWRVGTKAQDLIFNKNFSTHDLLTIATEEDGMLPMAITGIEKIVSGETSLNNIIKIVGADSLRHNKNIIKRIFFS